MVLQDGNLFSKTTQCLFYNYKPKPAQRMLDFDFLCGESRGCASDRRSGWQGPGTRDGCIVRGVSKPVHRPQHSARLQQCSQGAAVYAG